MTSWLVCFAFDINASPRTQNQAPRTQNMNLDPKVEPDSYLHTCGLVGRCGCGGCVWAGQISDVDVVEVDVDGGTDGGGGGVRS